MRLSPHTARSGQKPLLVREGRLNKRSSNLHATRRRPHSLRRREHTSLRTPHSFSAYWRLNDFRMTTQHAEVGRVSPKDDVARRLNPYAPYYRAPFACSAIPYPHGCWLASRLAFPERRPGTRTGLPRSTKVTRAG